MAFIIATIIAILSLGLGFLGMLASSMSSAPGKTSGVGPIVIGGLVLAVAVAASHFIGW